MPPLAVLHHQGRKSGTDFETPIPASRTISGCIVGLAYNPNANWAMNILDAGEARSGAADAATS